MGKCSRALISVRPEALRRVSGSWLGRRFAPLGLVWDDCSTPWRLLPARELGGGSPATCWRRLDEWAKAGVFDRLHLDVLDRLAEQGGLDWTRASVDSASMRAKRGGPRWRRSGRSWQAWVEDPPGLRRGRAAADRSSDRRQRPRCGHACGDGRRHPAVRTPAGRRRTRPGKLDADEGYDRVLQPALTTWRRAVAATRATRPGRSGKYLPSRKHHGTFLVVKYCR
jgi:hypothetical protein